MSIINTKGEIKTKESITNYNYYVSNYNWVWILEIFSLQGVPKGN